MHDEDYDEWNIKKKFINTQSRNELSTIQEGEIWWCSIGLNIGDEYNGKGEDFLRPVLIIKKLSKTTFFGIPLTSNNKNRHRLRIEFTTISNGVSVAILTQLRNLDHKRLHRYMDRIDSVNISRIKKALKAMF